MDLKKLQSVEEKKKEGKILFTFEDGKKQEFEIKKDLNQIEYIDIYPNSIGEDPYSILGEEIGKFIIARKDPFPLGNGFNNVLFLNRIGYSDEQIESLIPDIPRYKIDSFEKFFSSFSFFDSISIFSEEVDFSFSHKLKASYFFNLESIFLRKVNFSGVTFEQEADFRRVAFKEKVGFSYANFGKGADFSQVAFEQKADFRRVTFKEIGNFYLADFKNAKYVNFSGIKAEVLDFRNCDFGEETKVNFSHSKIERIFYSTKAEDKESGKKGIISLKAKNFENRETCLFFKTKALENNDQITALHFYSLEMEKYLEEAKGGDKIILWLEKWVSNFGTSPIRAICCFLGWNSIFCFLHFCFSFPLENLKYFSTTFFPFGNIDLFNPWLVFFQFIGNSFLVYEIIKSLRKFSRRL